MPELPEVETTRRGLLQHILHQQIVRVDVHRTDLREPLPMLFAKRVTGGSIADIRRRSKYLLIDLQFEQAGKLVMLVHLGMSGSLRICNEAEALRKHDHLVFHLSDKEQLRFHDPRRFGVVTLMLPEEEMTHRLLAHLGPEPFSDDFNVAYVKQALLRRHIPIKSALMDAKFVVGVGNIYASESLFLCGIHPLTPANQAAKHAKKIIQAVRQTLQAAIEAGGSTLRDYVQSKGETGYFQHKFNVYGRNGLPCVICKNEIKNKMLSCRATYWCDKCQPINA